MALKTVVEPNTYFDSVSLMAMSSKANALDGVQQAFVAMGTPMNKEVLRGLGLLTPELEAAGTGDLMIVLESDTAERADAAFVAVQELLHARTASAADGRERTYRTVASAAREAAGANLAVIAVNGAFAAREARTALENDLHVMLFSDNVDIEDEVALKQLAHERGLLMMGPDCGTAIIGGVGLCFANAVRRGTIGIVGASGTGSQEVSVRIHGLGGGISQLIGTGGRDLTERVGGVMMLDGIRALQEDPDTAVIVLVSKPPAEAVARTVLAAVEGSPKPVVVCFLGGAEDGTAPAGVTMATTTKDAALHAVRLAGVPSANGGDGGGVDRRAVDEIRAKLRPEQRFIRGLFCGGTLCDEAMHLAMARLDDVHSNISKDPDRRLPAHGPSVGHTFLDLGDDDFTNGRPHPMIDPSTRIARFTEEAGDPSVAVVVLDFILGYGSHEDPVGVMLPAIEEAKRNAAAQGRHLEILGYVLGTDQDRPVLGEQVEKLRRAGVTVPASSTDTGLLAREIVEASR